MRQYLNHQSEELAPLKNVFFFLIKLINVYIFIQRQIYKLSKKKVVLKFTCPFFLS